MQNNSSNSFMVSFSNFFSRPYLIIFCTILIAVLVIPALFYGIKDDPRLIPYFDHDEGYGRDLAWYYYTGEKLETFQYSLDYGVEYYLIIDFFVRPLSLFKLVDLGLFLFIMRLFHFIFGMIAIFLLWRFTKRHFFLSWIPTLTCITLVITPHFVSWLDHMKPEPFLLSLIILSLDYTLRILDEHSWKNLILAIFFSAAAFVVKFIGIFLLPVVLISLYFSSLAKKTTIKKEDFYPIVKKIGLIMLSMLICLMIFLSIIIPIGSRFYQKIKSENYTLENFASNFSFSKNLTFFVNTLIIFAVIGGIILIFWLYKKDKNSVFFQKVSIIPLFLIFSLIIGYRWSFNILKWGLTYVRWLQLQLSAPLNFFLKLKPDAYQPGTLLISNIKAWIVTFSENGVLGITGIMLLIIYFITEFTFSAWRDKYESKRFLKRVLILSYCLIFMLFLLLFQSRNAAHHLLSVVVLFFLLCFEGLRLLFARVSNKKIIFLPILIFSILLILINFYSRAAETIKSRLHKLNKNTDIVFEIGRWWKNTYPYDTKIVADSPCYVYIPSEFKNVTFIQPRLFLDKHFDINPEYTKKNIEKENPKLIFYNESKEENNIAPAIFQFLKGFRLKKIKEFKQSPSKSYFYREDKFIVYELLSNK